MSSAPSTSLCRIHETTTKVRHDEDFDVCVVTGPAWQRLHEGSAPLTVSGIESSAVFGSSSTAPTGFQFCPVRTCAKSNDSIVRNDESLGSPGRGTAKTDVYCSSFFSSSSFSSSLLTMLERIRHQQHQREEGVRAHRRSHEEIITTIKARNEAGLLEAASGKPPRRAGDCFASRGPCGGARTEDAAREKRHRRQEARARA